MEPVEITVCLTQFRREERSSLNKVPEEGKRADGTPASSKKRREDSYKKKQPDSLHKEYTQVSSRHLCAKQRGENDYVYHKHGHQGKDKLWPA